MVTAETIATALAKATAPQALAILRSWGKAKYDKYVALYSWLFDEYLTLTRAKCGQVKTLLNLDVALPITDLYVNLRFTRKPSSSFSNRGTDRSETTDLAIIERLANGPEGYVVSGLAGSGKSMFMRFAAISLLADIRKHQKIPMFLEIRDLSKDDYKSSLEEILFKYSTSPGNKTTIDQFTTGLNAGMFIIMLDGIDEAPSECLESLLKAIKNFRDNFRKTSIICSVRPGTQLPNISSMTHFGVKDMACSQIVEVLLKSPFSEQRKNALIEKIKDGLYEQHRSFLSNPLLATIMLVTFDDASRVPNKIAIFYAEAYKALFSRHDWSKGIFVRERRTNLDIDEFAKIFRLFCFNSFIKREFSFTDEELRTSIGSSIERARLSVETSDYIGDCIVSVCLLQEDPPAVTFVHRSFQEYFAADFVARYAGPNVSDLVRLFVDRFTTDNAYQMLCQMNQMLVIRAWAIETASEMLNQVDRLLEGGDDKYSKVFDYFGINFLGFEITSGATTAIGFTKDDTNYAKLNSVFMAADPEGVSEDYNWFSGSAFGEGGIGSAPEPMKRLTRLRVQDSQWSMVGIEKLQGPWVEQTGIPAIVSQLRERICAAKSYMERLVSEEDALTKVTGLIA